jgi:hypothetical protein
LSVHSVSKLELPKTVVVGGAEYKVLLTNRIPKVNGEKIFGLCCSGERKIWVRKSLPKDEQLSTFWHEVLHALDFEHGIEGLTHEVIYNLEQPLAWFFQDNPELYKLWMCEERGV